MNAAGRNSVGKDGEVGQTRAPGRAMSRIAKSFVLSMSFAGLLLGAADADALACTSVATGNWGVAGTWTSAGNCNRVPTVADTVTIATGHTVTVNVATANVQSITVNTGAILTQTLALSTAGALNVAGTLTSNNAMTVTGATTVTGNLNIVGAGARTFTGLVTVTGGTWNNSGNRAVTFRGGITNNGTFTAGTGTQTFNLAQAIGGANPINFGGIVAVVGAVTVTNNNTGGVTIAGNLTGSAAGSTWVNAANSTLNYGGALAPMGRRVFTASAVPNTVNYNGAAAQAVKTANYNNLTVTKPAGIAATTAAGTVNVTGALTVTSGRLNIAGTTVAVTGATSVSGTLGITSATGTKTFTGLVTVNPGGTWTNTTEAVTFRGGITNNGTFTGGTGTQTFNLTQAIAGSSPINFGGIVAVTGAVTVTNNNTSAVSIAGNLTGSAVGSTWVNGINSTLNYGGAAAPMGTRVFTASAVPNTVNYNRAGAQTMKQATYHHLTVSGSGVKATGAITLLVNGTTTVAGTATLNISSATGTKTFAGPVIVNAGCSWTNTANELVTFRGGITHNGTTFTAGTGTQTFDTNSQAIGGASPINFGGIVAVTGAVTVTNNNTNTVTVAGNLTGSVAGSTWVNAANSTLNYGGAAAPMSTGVLTASAAPNTVNYNRAGVQTVKVPSGAPATYYHLTLSGSGAKTLPVTAMTIAGNFTVSGTATATAAAALTVGGNWSETGTFAPGTQTVTLNGTSAQTISGTSPVNFNNLAVTNGTNPNITLATNVTVAGALTGTVTLTSTCPTDYTLTAGATVMHSCPPVTPPANFNCVESGASASTGHLYTRLAGTGFSFDVVALKADGTVETSYASTANKNVTVELVDGSGATACASRAALTPAVSQILTFTAADLGRKAATAMTVANAYANLRCRVTDANQIPNIVGCSTDNFSIRPTGFAVSSTDAGNFNTTGTPAIKTGAGFNLTAASVAGYNGTPAIDNTAGMVAGTPNAGTIGGAFAAAPPATGTAAGNAFFYSEAGNFGLGANAVFDNTFTSVDQPNDCTADFSNTLAGGKYGCNFGSSAVPLVIGSSGFGRFIPDNFNVSYTPPLLAAACGTFGYVGQSFSYTIAPVITVTARNGTANGLTNATTLNYAGAYMKLTNASLAQAPYDTTAGRYSRFDALGGGLTPALDTSGLPPAASDPAIGIFINGAGTLTFGAGTGLSFTRSITTPSAPFDADIALALNVADADGVAFAGNPASFGAPTAGNGIVFSGGKQMRYGRLKLANAHGSELLNLPVPIQTQSWNGTAFVTNTADNCTTLTTNNINLNPIVAGVSATVGGAFSSGVGSLILSRPTTPAKVGVNLCVDLGADPVGGTVCSATASANLPYLQGLWSPGASFNNDPGARATFGVYKGSNEFIYLREVY